jgi:hypothetical protein
MPDREWTVTEPLKNIPLVLKLFHEALEAYMPFSAHNRHATKHALHWYSDFEDICTDLDSEPALCEDLNQHIEQQTTIMTNLALRSIQLSADQHDGRLIKWLDGLVLSPPASSSQCVSERHRPSKLNLVAMKVSHKRLFCSTNQPIEMYFLASDAFDESSTSYPFPRFSNIKIVFGT